MDAGQIGWTLACLVSCGLIAKAVRPSGSWHMPAVEIDLG
jgi:hypothetical protein